MYDYSKLKGRIVEICGSQKLFAEKMGLSERSISLKMQQKHSFKQNEIEKAMGILSIGADDVGAYFFTYKVKSI